jgi:hypothetical protein
MAAELAKAMRSLVNDMSARGQGWRLEYIAAVPDFTFQSVAANSDVAVSV